MGNWKLIVPEAATNEVDNPSFEDNITDFWTSQDLGAGAAFARSTTRAKFGIASAQITAGDGVAQLCTDNISLANGETIYCSAWAYATTAGHSGIRIYDNTTPEARGDDTGTTADAWEKLEKSWTNTTGGTVNVSMRIRNGAADSSSSVWFDGVQVEIDSSSYTTYIDGTQPGCEWNGTPHNSTSSRSAQSTKGGVVQDLTDDYNFTVTAQIGVGAPQQSVIMDSYASLPGGELNTVGIGPRLFSLAGYVTGGTKAVLHTNRQLLVDALNPYKYSQVPQAVRLRYTGAAVDKEIDAVYTGGLEGDQSGSTKYEMMTLRFEAEDPWFYEVGESSQVLDSNDTATLRYVWGRLKSTGQWDDLGLTSDPAVGGTSEGLLYASDGYVYVGGGFTSMNGVAGRDYIARYDPITDTWATVGGASDFNGQVYALAEGPDGTIYAGGTFTNCAGVAAADYLAQWDGSNWTAVGTPNTGAAAISAITALAFDKTGLLLIGGNFTNLGDVAAADYFGTWDGSSYGAKGSGGTGTVDEIVVDFANGYLIVGNFINWAADANADYWAYWNGSAWSAPGDIALGGIAESAVIDNKGVIYVGGRFTDVDGDTTIDYLFSWDGTAVKGLGTAPNNHIYKLNLTPDNLLIAAGNYTEIGGLTTTNRVAIWNGASWAHLGLNHPASFIYAIATGPADPVVATNYDLYLTGDGSGSGYFAGKATTTNSGTATAYPRLIVGRSGGTSATLQTCRNETTGRGLLFDYSILDGEEITIDTHPQVQSRESDFFDAIPGAELAGDDLGDFALLPGANDITCFIDVAGAPTVVAYLLWKAAYLGVD